MKFKKQFSTETYISPDLDVVEILLGNNILAGSGEGDGSLDDMTGDFW